MKLRDYLNESKVPKLKAATRKKINKDLQKVLKQTYFNKIPLGDIFDVLEKYGIVPLQEDNTYWSGLLMGGRKQTEMVSIDLGWKEPIDVVSNYVYDKIPNAALVMTYYIMPSGKYEVIGYVS